MAHVPLQATAPPLNSRRAPGSAAAPKRPALAPASRRCARGISCGLVVVEHARACATRSSWPRPAASLATWRSTTSVWAASKPLWAVGPPCQCWRQGAIASGIDGWRRLLAGLCQRDAAAYLRSEGTRGVVGAAGGAAAIGLASPARRADTLRPVPRRFVGAGRRWDRRRLWKGPPPAAPPSVLRPWGHRIVESCEPQRALAKLTTRSSGCEGFERFLCAPAVAMQQHARHGSVGGAMTQRWRSRTSGFASARWPRLAIDRRRWQAVGGGFFNPLARLNRGKRVCVCV